MEAVETPAIENQPSIEGFEVIDDAVVFEIDGARVALDATALIDRLRDTSEQVGLQSDLGQTCGRMITSLERRPDPSILRDAAGFLRAVGVLPQPDLSYDKIGAERRNAKRRQLERTLAMCLLRRDAADTALIREELAKLDQSS